jgi:hypothetical protein
MSAPAKTIQTIGPTQMQNLQRFDSVDYYALTGTDLNDLAVLAERMNFRWDDANEMRDWQNRLNLMIMNTVKVT